MAIDPAFLISLSRCEHKVKMFSAIEKGKNRVRFLNTLRFILHVVLTL